VVSALSQYRKISLGSQRFSTARPWLRTRATDSGLRRQAGGDCQSDGKGLGHDGPRPNGLAACRTPRAIRHPQFRSVAGAIPGADIWLSAGALAMPAGSTMHRLNKSTEALISYPSNVVLELQTILSVSSAVFVHIFK